jgi:excisionase family DNA binding protein
MTTYSLRQVGDMLSVKERTVRGWIRLGKLKAARSCGWAFVVDAEELERFKREETWTPEDIVPYIRKNIPGMYKGA